MSEDEKKESPVDTQYEAWQAYHDKKNPTITDYMKNRAAYADLYKYARIFEHVQGILGGGASNDEIENYMLEHADVLGLPKSLRNKKALLANRSWALRYTSTKGKVASSRDILVADDAYVKKTQKDKEEADQKVKDNEKARLENKKDLRKAKGKSRRNWWGWALSHIGRAALVVGMVVVVGAITMGAGPFALASSMAAGLGIGAATITVGSLGVRGLGVLAKKAWTNRTLAREDVEKLKTKKAELKKEQKKNLEAQAKLEKRITEDAAVLDLSEGLPEEIKASTERATAAESAREVAEPVRERTTPAPERAAGRTTPASERVAERTTPASERAAESPLPPIREDSRRSEERTVTAKPKVSETDKSVVLDSIYKGDTTVKSDDFKVREGAACTYVHGLVKGLDSKESKKIAENVTPEFLLENSLASRNENDKELSETFNSGVKTNNDVMKLLYVSSLSPEEIKNNYGIDITKEQKSVIDKMAYKACKTLETSTTSAEAVSPAVVLYKKSGKYADMQSQDEAETLKFFKKDLNEISDEMLLSIAGDDSNSKDLKNRLIYIVTNPEISSKLEQEEMNKARRLLFNYTLARDEKKVKTKEDSDINSNLEKYKKSNEFKLEFGRRLENAKNKELDTMSQQELEETLSLVNFWASIEEKDRRVIREKIAKLRTKEQFSGSAGKEEKLKKYDSIIKTIKEKDEELEKTNSELFKGENSQYKMDPQLISEKHSKIKNLYESGNYDAIMNYAENGDFKVYSIKDSEGKEINSEVEFFGGRDSKGDLILESSGLLVKTLVEKLTKSDNEDEKRKIKTFLKDKYGLEEENVEKIQNGITIKEQDEINEERKQKRNKILDENEEIKDGKRVPNLNARIRKKILSPETLKNDKEIGKLLIEIENAISKDISPRDAIMYRAFFTRLTNDGALPKKLDNMFYGKIIGFRSTNKNLTKEELSRVIGSKDGEGYKDKNVEINLTKEEDAYNNAIKERDGELISKESGESLIEIEEIPEFTHIHSERNELEKMFTKFNELLQIAQKDEDYKSLDEMFNQIKSILESPKDEDIKLKFNELESAYKDKKSTHEATKKEAKLSEILKYSGVSGNDMQAHIKECVNAIKEYPEHEQQILKYIANFKKEYAYDSTNKSMNLINEANINNGISQALFEGKKFDELELEDRSTVSQFAGEELYKIVKNELIGEKGALIEDGKTPTSLNDKQFEILSKYKDIWDVEKPPIDLEEDAGTMKNISDLYSRKEIEIYLNSEDAKFNESDTSDQLQQKYKKLMEMYNTRQAKVNGDVADEASQNIYERLAELKYAAMKADYKDKATDRSDAIAEELKTNEDLERNVNVRVIESIIKDVQKEFNEKDINGLSIEELSDFLNAVVYLAENGANFKGDSKFDGIISKEDEIKSTLDAKEKEEERKRLEEETNRRIEEFTSAVENVLAKLKPIESITSDEYAELESDIDFIQSNKELLNSMDPVIVMKIQPKVSSIIQFKQNYESKLSADKLKEEMRETAKDKELGNPTDILLADLETMKEAELLESSDWLAGSVVEQLRYEENQEKRDALYTYLNKFLELSEREENIQASAPGMTNVLLDALETEDNDKKREELYTHLDKYLETGSENLGANTSWMPSVLLNAIKSETDPNKRKKFMTKLTNYRMKLDNDKNSNLYHEAFDRLVKDSENAKIIEESDNSINDSILRQIDYITKAKDEFGNISKEQYDKLVNLEDYVSTLKNIQIDIATIAITISAEKSKYKAKTVEQDELQAEENISKETPISEEKIEEQTQEIDVTKPLTSEMFDKFLKEFSDVHSAYYDGKKGTKGNAHTEDEKKLKQKLNDDAKSVLRVSQINGVISEDNSEIEFASSMEIDENVMTSVIENDAAVMKLMGIMASGVYKGKKLNQQERINLAKNLAEIVRIREQNKNSQKNSGVTESGDDANESGS